MRMRAGYWFVQPYHVGGKVDAEQPCADCGEAVAKVKAFKSTKMNPNLKLRVNVPAYASDDECRQIQELGVESIMGVSKLGHNSDALGQVSILGYRKRSC